ncbi:MAG: PAS domain S-box protein [Desulfamplus sp.]
MNKYTFEELEQKLEELEQVKYELEHTKEALKQSDKLWHSMFENHHAVMLLIDADSGGIVRANKAALMFYGYSVEEFEKLRICDINQLPNEEIDLEMKKAFVEERNYFNFIHKISGGENVSVEVYSSPAYFKGKDCLFSIVHDITEINQTRAALKESNDRLKLALKSAKAGCWEWDLRTNENIWSDEIWDIYGLKSYPGSKPSYDLWLQSINPNDRDIASSIVQAAASSGEKLNVEWRVNHEDGKQQWIMSRGEPEHDEYGKVIRYQGVVIDITDRKRIEETQAFLAQTASGNGDETFFKVIARYLARSLEMDFVCIDMLEGDGLTARTVAIWSDDHFDDNITYTLKDTPCGEAVGKTICCFPSKVRQLFPKDIVLQEMCAESYVGVTLFSHTLKPIGLIAVIGRKPLKDRWLAETMMEMVGVRAAAEMERLDAEEALRERTERYELVMAGASAAIWDWDVPNKRVFFSPQWKSMRGYAEDEVGDSEDEWKNNIHPDETSRVMAALKNHFKEQTPVFEEEYRVRCKNGSYKWISDRGISLFDKAGVVLRMAGSEVDITERKNAEEKRELNEIRLKTMLNIIQYRANTSEEFLKNALNEVLKLTGSKIGYILFYNEESKQFTLNTWSYAVMEECRIVQPPTVYELEKTGIWGEAVRQRTAIIINDYNSYHSSKKGYPEGHVNVNNFMTIPVFSNDKIVAVVGVADKERDYNEIDVLQLTLLMDSVWKFVEIKRGEDALRESEERFKALHNASFGGIAIHDKGVILECNQGLSDMTGYSIDELISMNGLLLISEKTRDMVMSNILAGYEKPYEAVGLRKNGKKYPMRLEARNIPYKGKTVRVVEFRDITEHKKTELSLRESEEKYRSMMESMDDAAFICSSERIIEYMNFAMTKKVGHNLIGELCYKSIYGFNEPCPWCLSKKVLNGDSIKTEVVSPNDNKTYSVSFSPIFHTDNTVSVLHVLRDITDIKAIETKLQQAQKMEAVGVLAGGIAHDFNNILSPIMGYTQLLSEDIPKESPLRSSLDEIYAASMRAKDMVRQILTFARQEKGEVRLMKMHHIVKEALKLIRSTIPATIDIKQDIRKECGLINADPTQIHQIVMNLATNAYHAMEETGGTMRVSLKEAELNPELNEQDIVGQYIQKGIYACLTVSDTGAGIPEDIRDKIFDPFFTTKKQGKGTGLGLSSVHGIVTSCGGFIRLHSELGRGTEFNIYLPVVESYLKKDDALQVKMPMLGGNERILLVDDEAVLITLQKGMLERLGYNVTSRTSSIEALEAFRSNPDKFDMVITDMAMPSMSGDKLAVELIKIRPDIPVLLCTGFSTIMSEEKALSIGIKGFLMKPVTISDIDKKIRDVLDNNK